MKRASLVLLCALLTACGGDDDGDGGGDGAGGLVSAGTHSFNVRGSGSFAATVTCTEEGASLSNSVLAVSLADLAGVCSFAEEREEPANSSSLDILILRTNFAAEAARPITEGTYPVTDFTFPDQNGEVMLVAVAIVRNDATCDNAAGDDAEAESGTVTIDTITSRDIQGRVDVTLFDGTRVTANFDAPRCSGLSGQDLACTAPETTCVP